MLRFFKGDPSKYIIKFVSGKIKKKGIGISFYYFDHNCSVFTIPATTIDSNFIFNEISKNFQPVIVQGHLTYRIKDPVKMASLLNFEIFPDEGEYVSGTALRRLVPLFPDVFYLSVNGILIRRNIGERFRAGSQIVFHSGFLSGFSVSSHNITPVSPGFPVKL